MTDNARIVREALENCTTGYAEESSNRVCSGCGSSIGCEPNCPVQDAITALDCLESELATAKADLERAREEARAFDKALVKAFPRCYDAGVGTFRLSPEDCAAVEKAISRAERMVWGALRAALAPEQKH